jgi:hypothetical protein
VAPCQQTIPKVIQLILGIISPVIQVLFLIGLQRRTPAIHHIIIILPQRMQGTLEGNREVSTHQLDLVFHRLLTTRHFSSTGMDR